MSEPARHYPAQDLMGRPTPGPLRDWLAAMKAATSSQGGETQSTSSARPEQHGLITEKVAPFERSALVDKPEPTAAWEPRIVQPPAPLDAADDDISELMAENLVLKAQLKLEAGRYDQIQSVLAQELRRLRSHVEAEMAELDEVRSERDRLVELQTLFIEELDDARARFERDAMELDQVRSERDLWMARAEALAQPLFQKR